MKEKVIAKRYVEAFLAFCRPGIGKEKAVEELRAFKMLMHTAPALRELLFSMEITFPEKRTLVERILHAYFSEEFRHFLILLIEKERIRLIEEMCDYARHTYAHGGAQEALLSSSYPLDLALLEEIKGTLERVLRKKLSFYLQLEPQLLGGLTIRIGNTLLDGSVRRRLEDLREKLRSVAA